MQLERYGISHGEGPIYLVFGWELADACNAASRTVARIRRKENNPCSDIIAYGKPRLSQNWPVRLPAQSKTVSERLVGWPMPSATRRWSASALSKLDL